MYDDATLLNSMGLLIKVPVLLDDNPEMQVGVMLINPEYREDFDACPPMKTHRVKCPVHGQHVDHYSLPGLDRKQVRIDINITPVRPGGVA